MGQDQNILVGLNAPHGTCGTNTQTRIGGVESQILGKDLVRRYHTSISQFSAIIQNHGMVRIRWIRQRDPVEGIRKYPSHCYLFGSP